MTILIYMTAGLSSRFGGRIKQFAEIGPNNETLIEYSMNQAIQSNFSKIIFIVGDLTETPFRKKFGNSYKGVKIEYANQKFDKELRDKPWGTVDALCSALHLINEPVIVCNGDDIYGKSSFKILDDHLKNNNQDATLGYKLIDTLPEKGSVNRGIFKIENNYVKNLEEIFEISKENYQEKFDQETLCSMNIFALHIETIKKIKNRLDILKQKNSKERKLECLLPNEISNLIKERKIKMRIYPSNESWFGITNPEDELIVREKLKNKG